MVGLPACTHPSVRPSIHSCIQHLLSASSVPEFVCSQKNLELFCQALQQTAISDAGKHIDSRQTAYYEVTVSIAHCCVHMHLNPLNSNSRIYNCLSLGGRQESCLWLRKTKMPGMNKEVSAQKKSPPKVL